MKEIKVRDLLTLLDGAEKVLISGALSQGVDLVCRCLQPYYVEDLPEELPEVLDLIVYHLYFSSIYRCFVLECDPDEF